ncbi:Allophanate hydrolase 2 subunit 2 [hydrothermal vent metagenome]|uniref:Allophanate hydrolase 2 subunit 2 n=1 Tax=hydrothermal vent metagenome TaxID=652676 RepID=A0A3B0U6L0_9ZZZZ
MLKILQSGLHTSIQDIGRFGYRNIGVPTSGTMDAISANFANALLNNNKNDAVLEITMYGPKLAFTVPTVITITGAEMSAKLNNISIANYKKYSIKNGDILSFGELTKGLRCYLAVKGGFKTAKVLKSRSFYNGITLKDTLKKQDTILYNSYVGNENSSNSAIKNTTLFFETNVLEVYKGPDFNLFTLEEQQKIYSNKYTISNLINRMGYRIKETVIKHHKSILTSPVLPGTVQLTPSGQLIILMKDAQTTGGYPRIFQLTEKSIAILAQKKEGDIFSFLLV